MGWLPIASVARIIAYCGTCQIEWGTASELYIGERFRCPREKEPRRDPHLTGVVKSPPGKFWLWLEAGILRYEKKCSPFRCFNTWGGQLKGRAGYYLAARFLVLLSYLWIASFPELCWKILSFFYAAFFYCDIVLSNTSTILISREQQNWLRSAIFLVLTLGQLAMVFAIFYVVFALSFKNFATSDPVHAMYFSALTIVGEVHLKPQTGVTHFLVGFEVLTGFYFFGLLVATVVSGWANTPHGSQELLPFDTVLRADGGNESSGKDVQTQ